MGRTLIWLAVPALLVVGAVIYSHSSSPGNHEVAELPAYYLPHGQECTVLLDCSSLRSRLEKLSPGQTQTLLARRLVAELKSERGNKVAQAVTVHLHAVYFTGIDNYGRPNFASRQTLLQLSATPEALRNLSDAELADPERLRQTVQVATLDKAKN